MGEYLPWQLRGTYLESCNCDAICPCRTIGGRKGGRSTYGECLGALSWRIEAGHAGEVSLSGLDVVTANRYHDDEPGSPWSFVVHDLLWNLTPVEPATNSSKGLSRNNFLNYVSV